MRISKASKELLLPQQKGSHGSKLLMRHCKDFCSRGGKGKEHVQLLKTWQHDSDETILRLCTEVAAGGSGGKGAAKAFAVYLIEQKAVGGVISAAADLLETFSAASAHTESEHKKAGTKYTPGLGRRYCLQYIWLVLHNTKQAQATSDKGGDEQEVVEKFEAVVVNLLLEAIEKFKQPLTVPEYHALFEIALDDVIAPSAREKGREVEPFGRRIARAAIFGIISQLIESAALQTRLLFMKSMNVVLLRRVDENASAVIENKFWSDWFWCLVDGLPMKASDRNEDENNLCKYFFNTYATLHNHSFSNTRSDPFDATLSCTLNGLAMFNGWRPDGVNCARLLFDTFLVKLCAGVKSWKREYFNPQWENLFKLSAMIERFLFFQPAILSDEACKKHDAPLLLTRSTTPTDTLKDTAGIHFDAQTLECLDTSLVKRFLALMKQLGYTGGDIRADPSLTKQETKRRQLANDLTKDFGKIYQFLQKASKIKSLDTFTEKVATFMKSRSSKWSKIKIGKGNSKQNLQKIISQYAFRSHAIQKIQVAHDEVAQVATQLEVETANAIAKVEPVAVPCTATKIADMVAQAEARARVSKVPQPIVVPEEKLCPACHTPVDPGDSTALSALGQWWHREHFSCHHCHKNLAVAPVVASLTDSKVDAKTAESELEFFARDEHPFCRKCYLSLFATTVCAGCMKPVKKNQQIVKACGYLWHTECFQCTKCSTDLARVPFKNQDNKPYCKQCFSDEFMMCPGCKGPIEDISDGFHAMGRNWHRNCFVCAHCMEPFAGDDYMAVDTGNGPKPYCRADYERLFVPICPTCREPIRKDCVTVGSKSFHRHCLTCVVCQDQLDNFYIVDGKNYCEKHYYSECTRTCAKCNKPCTGYFIEHNDLVYHQDCFTCEVCGKDGELYVVDNKPYCEQHYGSVSQSICAACGETISGMVRAALGKKWHPECLVCFECKRQLSDGKDNPDLLCCQGADGHPYCMVHYAANFSKTCHKCRLPLNVHEKFVNARSGNVFHRQCFRCDLCSKGLLGTRSFEVKGYLYCEDCFHAQSSDRCPTCFQPVLRTDKHRMAFGKLYHWDCLQCYHCLKPFEGKQRFRRKEDKLYCDGCFVDVFVPSCAGCLKKINGGFAKVGPRHPTCIRLPPRNKPRQHIYTHNTDNTTTNALRFRGSQHTCVTILFVCS